MNKREFPKEQKASKKYLRGDPEYLTIREMKIQTALRFLLIPVRRTKSNKATNSTQQRGCGEREPSVTVNGIANQCSHCGNPCAEFSKS